MAQLLNHACTSSSSLSSLQPSPLGLASHSQPPSRSSISLARRAPVPAACRASASSSAEEKVRAVGRRGAAAGAAAFVAAAAAAATIALTPFGPGDAALAYIGGGPYGREVTRGQDLSGRDFSNLDLTGQDFKTSILRQANFRGSKLVGASFFDADLTGADFTDADLRGADFSLTSAVKANFTNVLFEGVSVTGNTSFKGSIITGADFTDVLFRDDIKRELCKVADGVNPVTGNETRDTLFC